MNITISKHFQDLIYPLTKEELTVLEQSVLKYGVKDPLVVWENGRNYLLDGHHRYTIIKKHNINKYKVLKLNFENKYEAINWILDNQLGRRNCTPEGLSYLRGLRYKNEKHNHGGRRISSPQNGDLKTSQILAEQYKVSKNTIERDESFANAVDAIIKTYPTLKKQKEIKHKILTRQINLSKKDVIELSELSARFIDQVLSEKKELWQVKLAIEQKRKKRKKKTVRIVLPRDIKIIVGNCITELKKIKKNSIDSCVTDPPYGISFIGKEWDNFSPKTIAKKTTNHQISDHKKQSGRSASSQASLYDTSLEGSRVYQDWCHTWGVELMRVIKPGGHILMCCSPRMYHRITVGLEDAGWEIRDTISWNFFSGFPKSRNISKDIDNAAGSKGVIIAERKQKGAKFKQIQHLIDNGGFNDPNRSSYAVTVPATDAAKEWDGWGTNLKPGMELICLARKPITESTLAKNVIKWGTGAINISACKISDEQVLVHNGPAGKFAGTKDIPKKTSTNNSERIDRYPANTIFDEKAGQLLNQQSGQEASRFFYCPKVSLEERNAGCESLEHKQQNSESNIRTYNDRCGNCGKKFIGPKHLRCQCPKGKKLTDKTVYKNPNNHPTVKPINLCRYLCRLITPPGGTCIDIFMGSGSTGIACVKEGFKFIGIEKEQDYYIIAKHRIASACKNARKTKKRKK